jgi:hypothetical protein
MADEGSAPTQMVDEIANLLDQCSPEELTNILQAIEGGDGVDVVLDNATEQKAPLSPAPVPPSAPPPASGTGRRPAPAGYKKSGGEGDPDEAVVSVGEMKKILEAHSAGVLNEVRKMVNFPTMPSPGPSLDPASVQADLQTGALNLEVLTTILAQRDDEVKGLEARLSELQDQLSFKDRRIMDLNGELDCAVREVRHRQLDLEFQQLKLEERVRSNNELEQAHRSLTARVEDAHRETRHAALDVDLARSMPRTARVQGSLPWMLRKNRPWTGDAWGTP